MIHFATHGLLAGETATLSAAHAEPALVMSPPDVVTEEDDGLLTASEIAGLKLDADWVVMSACNTAGGGEQGAEALSGLARGVFDVGARALLVSHWPVNSYAAIRLTSPTFALMSQDKSIGRSEAFRRAVLALMSDEDRPWAAHPSVWAPSSSLARELRPNERDDRSRSGLWTTQFVSRFAWSGSFRTIDRHGGNRRSTVECCLQRNERRSPKPA